MSNHISLTCENVIQSVLKPVDYLLLSEKKIATNVSFLPHPDLLVKNVNKCKFQLFNAIISKKIVSLNYNTYLNSDEQNHHKEAN